MKSLFQEGSSLGNAVEKAWEEAGSPESFVVKVLKVGEKGFWGFGGTPFTISINVGINPKDSAKQSSQENASFSRTNKDQAPRKDDRSRTEKSDRERTSKQGARPDRQDRFKKKDSSVARPSREDNDESRSSAQMVPADNWSQSLAEKAISLFKESLEILGINPQSLKHRIEESNLVVTLTLDSNSEYTESDTGVFISLAPLVVQMAKKNSAETLKGLKLIIETESV